MNATKKKVSPIAISAAIWAVAFLVAIVMFANEKQRRAEAAGGDAGSRGDDAAPLVAE
ncbi:MAG: hypothetical protein R3F34_09130 [Planctomycetota bacterium]